MHVKDAQLDVRTVFAISRRLRNCEGCGCEGVVAFWSMANHVSSLKRARQTVTRTEVNRANRSRVRTSLRALREALAKGDVKAAQAQYRETVSTLDKSVQKGIHDNTSRTRQHRLPLQEPPERAAEGAGWQGWPRRTAARRCPPRPCRRRRTWSPCRNAPSGFHLLEQRCGQLGAGAAQRMAERDGAAVDVDALRVELRPSSRMTASTCAAKASFNSMRPMSSSVRPARFSALGMAVMGPMPISSGRQPVTA
jgi:small subunit ribosomal protein S20